jgi:serine/threonine protein kinase/tetratricopeptide (TPR) repeat protein
MPDSPIEQEDARRAPDDLAGRTVGRFAIRARLGGGGMGEVYLADDTVLKRRVALKRIAPALRSDARSRQRLRKEAETASRLNDSGIASVYDVFEEGNEIFIVMEYVEGENLRRRLEAPITIREFLSIALKCANALAAAHAAGIIHRDIKPENIMLTPAGQVKILDFGFARNLPGSTAATTQVTLSSDRMSGTLAYMAPEVLSDKETDARTDIFSLGVVFYETLAGRNPFRTDRFLDTCDRILHVNPVPLRESNPQVTPEIERIINTMLAKNPPDRYPSAAALANDLAAAEGAPSSTRPESTARVQQPRLIKSLWKPAVALTVAVLLGMAGYWILRSGKPVATTSSGATVAPVRTIAILPFRRIGGSAQYDYFGVGLAQVLNAKLTNARFLEVHSPGGALNRADQTSDPLELGRNLKVDAVLSGTYQIDGTTLSLSYTLLDVRRNVQIAGDAFTDPFTQSVQVEHRLASEIVDSLQVSATAEEMAHFTSPPTRQADAFQAYLRSKYAMESFWKQPSAEQLSQAERLLNEALQTDPHFSLALVSLAKLHWTSVFWGYSTDPAILQQAEQEASRAIKEDPGHGEAYAVRALIEFQQGQLDRAEGSLRTAFLRSPNSALACYAAGFYYLGRGLPDMSVRAFRRARDLDPELVRRELTIAYRYQVDLPRAEQQARQDLAEHPDDVENQQALASILAARGNLAEAQEIAQRLQQTAPDDPGAQDVIALVSVRAGKPFSVDSWLRRFRQNYWADPGYCANVAGVLALAHRNREALQWLRRAGELGMRNYPFISNNPVYENLRGDAEFQSYRDKTRAEWEQAKKREELEPLLPPSVT